jgi:hypothetical protein
MAIGKGEVVEQVAIQDVLDLKKALEGCSVSLKEVVKTASGLSVNIKNAESTRALGDETKKLTLAQTELQKVEKQIQVVQAKNNEDYIKQAKLLQEAKDQLKQKTKATIEDTKAVNAQNSSLQTLDKALQKNRETYSKLANEQARNSVEGKKLLAIIQSQDKASKELSGTLGQSQKHVGDYANQIGNLSPALEQGVSSAQKFGKALATLALNPIVLLLAAIVGTLAVMGKAVSMFFEDTLEGQEKLNELMGTYDATVATVKEGMVDLGKSIVDSFSNGTALKDFGNSLLHLAALIANPIQAITELSAKASEIAAKVAEKERIATALAKIRNDLVKEHIRDVVDDGNTELKVNELLEKSKDKLNNSDKKRLQFLKDAVGLLREQVKGDILLAETDLKAAEEKIKLNGGVIQQNKLLSDYSDKELYALKTNADGIQELANKQVALLKIKSDAAAKEKGFTRLISAAQLEIEKAERDRIERSLKANEDYQRKLIEGVMNANNAILKDENTSLEDKQKALEDNLNENSKLYELDAANAIRTLKNSIRDRLISESEDYSDKSIEADKSFIKERDSINKDAYNKDLVNLQNYFDGIQSIYINSYKQIQDKTKRDSENKLILLQDELIKGTKTVEQYEKAKVDLQHDSNQASYTELLASLKSKIEALKANNQDVTALLKALHDVEVALSNDATQKIIDDEKKKEEAEKNRIAAIQTATKFIYGQINDINNASASNQITKLDQELKAFQDLQSGKLDAVKQSEAEQTALAGDNQARKDQIAKDSVAQQDKINAQTAKKEKQINDEKNRILRRQAIFEKGLALVQAAINIEQAATKAYAQGGIYGAVLAGVVVALGAVQLALIAQKPIPQFFKGTDSAPGGLAWVGEQGAELMRKPGGNFELTPRSATLMDVPRGTEIVPHDQTMKMLAMSALLRNGGSVQEKDSALIDEVRKLNSNIGNIKQTQSSASHGYMSGLIAYEAKQIGENHIKHQRIISLGKWVK